jgi:hypothetical protein
VHEHDERSSPGSIDGADDDTLHLDLARKPWWLDAAEVVLVAGGGVRTGGQRVDGRCRRLTRGGG